MYRTLSQYVLLNPKAVDLSQERLTCISHGVETVDIHSAVLAVLTEKASLEVRVAAQRYAEVSGRSLTTTGPPLQPISSPNKSKAAVAEEDGFNIAIALSLHTVLLSRNRLTTTLGLVQFKHVVRLSLLGNRLARIEDCEPLGLLHQLAYLSLEYNPVASLPHYRAHLLRICSFPAPLSSSNCRLSKLDAKAVTENEIQHSIRCLDREGSLLPVLVKRQQFLSFLSHLERTRRLHHEMQKRGVLLVSPETPASLDRILRRCAGVALNAVDVALAAHMMRRFLSHQLNARKRRRANRNGGGGEGDDSLAVSYISSAANWSLDISAETHTSSDGCITDLGDASKILLGDLHWNHTALQQIRRSTHDVELEDEWGKDLFQQTISWIDVRMCTLLLRLARMLEQTLSSRDVDLLCQLWEHTVTHHTDVLDEDINLTGKRRPIVIRVTTARNTRARALQQPKREPIVAPTYAIEGSDISIIRCDAERPMTPPPAPSTDCPQPEPQWVSSPILSTPPVDCPSATALAGVVTGPGPREVSCSTNTEPSQSQIKAVTRQRCRRAAFRKWQCAVLRRGDRAICDQHIRSTVQNLISHRNTSPVNMSSVALVWMLPYHERRVYFFAVWRRRADEQRTLRWFQRHVLLHRWKRRTREAASASLIQRLHTGQLLGHALRLWHQRASVHLLRRLECAKERIAAESTPCTPIPVWQHLRRSNTALDSTSVSPLATGKLLRDALSPLLPVTRSEGCGLSDDLCPNPVTPSGNPLCFGAMRHVSPDTLKRQVGSALDAVLQSRDSGASEVAAPPALGLRPPPAMETPRTHRRYPASRDYRTGAVQFTSLRSRSPLSPSPHGFVCTPSHGNIFSPPPPTRPTEAVANTLEQLAAPAAIPAHLGSVAPVQHPFSEDDVSLLVKRATILQTDRAALLQRLADLQRAHEQAHVDRQCREEEIEKLKESIGGYKQREVAQLTALQKQQTEIHRLQQCVELLREERREWVDEMLAGHVL